VTRRWTLTAPVQAAVLLSLIALGGTAGYMLIERWSAWDAFYMTIISLTTVGYREVHPLSRAGEAFTALLLVGGVGTVLYSFTLIGARVIEGTLHNPWERRREKQMLAQLENHFIVCGYGRIGAIVVDDFQRQTFGVIVIGIRRASGRMVQPALGRAHGGGRFSGCARHRQPTRRVGAPRGSAGADHLSDTGTPASLYVKTEAGVVLRGCSRALPSLRPTRDPVAHPPAAFAGR
jgi:hypothetical protein